MKIFRHLVAITVAVVALVLVHIVNINLHAPHLDVLQVKEFIHFLWVQPGIFYKFVLLMNLIIKPMLAYFITLVVLLLFQQKK